MASSPSYGDRPPLQGFRRSFTAPHRQPSVRERVPLSEADADSGALFTHPSVKIIGFSPPPESIVSKSSDTHGDADYPIDTVETLPWRSRTEDLAASGSMVIEKIKASTWFIKCGSQFIYPLLRNSQCWCVDGESKFVWRKGRLQYYRLELPNATEEEKAKVEELKLAFSKVLKFEKTPCPFIRGFHVDLPDDAITPRRKGKWNPKEDSLPNTPDTDTPSLRRTKGTRSFSLQGQPSVPVPESRRPSDMGFAKRLYPALPRKKIVSEARPGTPSSTASSEEAASQDRYEYSDGGSSVDETQMVDDTEAINETEAVVESKAIVDDNLASLETETEIPDVQEKVEDHEHAEPEPSVSAASEREESDVEASHIEDESPHLDPVLENVEDETSRGSAPDSPSAKAGSIEPVPGPAEVLSIADHDTEVDERPTEDDTADIALHKVIVQEADAQEQAPPTMPEETEENQPLRPPETEPQSEHNLEDNSQPEHADKDVESGQLAEIESATGQEEQAEAIETEETAPDLIQEPVTEIAETAPEPEPATEITSEPVSADEDFDDNTSIASTVESFHTVASEDQHPSFTSQDHPVAQADRLSSPRFQHKRGISEMTITASNFDEDDVAERPSTPRLIKSSASDDSWPDVKTPANVQDGIRQRLKSRRSHSPLPPSSIVYTSAGSNPGNHMTSVLLQKACNLALVKPIEVVVLVVHILVRIAGGASLNDLLTGELFKQPEQDKRNASFPDRLSPQHDDDEDDFGVPLRGRTRSTESNASQAGHDADTDSLFDLD